MAQLKYCGNCKQWVTPTTGVRWGIAILLLIFFFFPGIIYILWKLPQGGKCPMCNSKNWSIPPKEEKEKESK